MKPTPDSTSNPWAIAVCVAALVLLVLFAYAPVHELGFVPLDDPIYVTGNSLVQRGLTGEGVEWAFRSFRAGNWHPLTWISHMADVQIFGFAPRPFHWVNVALHTLNAALLFWWLTLSTSSTKRPWAAFLVAALFVAHPLRVESVAWISERKDLLAGCFWLLALLAYQAYVSRPKWWRMALVALAMAASLMAKPMAVTLPCVLLLLDYWPHRRWTSGRDLGSLALEKVPLLLLSVAASVVAVIGQRKVGAMQSLESLPFSDRLAQAFIAYSSYLMKTLWPSHLAVLYPHPALVLPRSEFLLHAGASALVVLVLTVVVWHVRTRRPEVFVGWAWYLGVLVPVIGIVQVGSQAMADRYTYLPVLGFWIAVVYGGGALLPPRWRRFSWAGLLLISIVFGWYTRQQVEVWKDGRSLYEHAIAVTDSNEQALAGLGVVLLQSGEAIRAEALLRQSLQINPKIAVAHHSLGILEQQRGQVDEARAHFEEAIRLNSLAPEPRTGLGDLERGRGDVVAAEQAYRDAIRVDPSFRPARLKLAKLLNTQGRFAEAQELLVRLLEVVPGDLNARQELALTWIGEKNLPAARLELERVLEADPRRARAHYELAGILMESGELDRARRHLERAQQLAPQVHAIGNRLEELKKRMGQR